MPQVPFTSIYPDGPAGSDAAQASSGGGGSGNDLYPGMPAGAIPVHRDLSVSAAGTFTVWTPQAGNRFVLTSALVSTDTAGRIALVDGADMAGFRPVVGRFAANGGAAPNLVPVPYVSKQLGNSLLLVVGTPGNVDVEVRGYEVSQ